MAQTCHDAGAPYKQPTCTHQCVYIARAKQPSKLLYHQNPHLPSPLNKPTWRVQQVHRWPISCQPVASFGHTSALQAPLASTRESAQQSSLTHTHSLALSSQFKCPHSRCPGQSMKHTTVHMQGQPPAPAWPQPIGCPSSAAASRCQQATMPPASSSTAKRQTRLMYTPGILSLQTIAAALRCWSSLGRAAVAQVSTAKQAPGTILI